MFYQAIKLALELHEGQTRKLGGDPYVIHPLEVGYTLLENGADQTTAIAGILHDVLEDTNIDEGTLESLFGKPVLILVKQCSEPDKSLAWLERKKHSIDALKKADRNVKLIYCADKLSNLKSISHYSTKNPDCWHFFNAGYAQQKWFYHEIIHHLTELEKLAMYHDLKCYFEKVFQNDE